MSLHASTLEYLTTGVHCRHDRALNVTVLLTGIFFFMVTMSGGHRRPWIYATLEDLTLH